MNIIYQFAVIYGACALNDKEEQAIDHILSAYKRVLKENEELKKDYYNVINKIENKIDRFDYEFEKAKRQNNKDKSDYYWDLIINFKKLLDGNDTNVGSI